jgi:hypothetical protein
MMIDFSNLGVVTLKTGQWKFKECQKQIIPHQQQT